jgi:hypothetical protein
MHSNIEIAYNDWIWDDLPVPLSAMMPKKIVFRNKCM